VANCSGGGATVTATTVVWSPPGTVANSGCIDSGIGTSITYTSGSLGAGVVGNILDLSAGVLPVNDFMTFSGTPLDFVLTGVGPGLTNTNCALSPSNSTCSPFAGSPFILTYISPNVTGVALGVVGTVNDGTGGTTATWNGSFTTQLNMSGTTIQSTEAGGGSISSAQSGNFSVTVSTTPEPSTMVMMLLGGGLIALTTVRRRRNS
jgi:PEP-CTERM motif